MADFGTRTKGPFVVTWLYKFGANTVRVVMNRSVGSPTLFFTERDAQDAIDRWNAESMYDSRVRSMEIWPLARYIIETGRTIDE